MQMPPPGSEPDYLQTTEVPQAPRAEKALLSAFLNDGLTVALAIDEGLRPSDFYISQHRAIAAAVLDLGRNGREVNEITVIEALRRNHQLRNAGGERTVREIKAADEPLQQFDSYIREVREASTLRWAIEQGRALQEKAQLPNCSSTDLTEFFESTSQELQERTARTAGRQRFSLISAPQFKSRPKPEFLVDGILVENTLSLLEGEPGSYKSFLAIALAGSVSTGTPWFEREVRSGPVIYISGEGSAGLAHRVKAWEIHNNAEFPADCYFLPEAVQLMQASDLDALAAAIRQLPEPPVLTVIDTLARCMVGGEENSAKDMGVFIAGADRIRTLTGGHVLIVHHQGKDGKTRGSSSLPGAMDTMISVERQEGRLIVTCKKQKDAAEFPRFELARQVVELDESGDASLVFDVVSQQAQRDARKKLEAQAYAILEKAPKGLIATGWKNAVMKATGCSESTFFRTQRDLVSQNLTMKTGKVYVAINAHQAPRIPEYQAPVPNEEFEFDE